MTTPIDFNQVFFPPMKDEFLLYLIQEAPQIAALAMGKRDWTEEEIKAEKKRSAKSAPRGNQDGALKLLEENLPAPPERPGPLDLKIWPGLGIAGFSVDLAIFYQEPRLLAAANCPEDRFQYEKFAWRIEGGEEKVLMFLCGTPISSGAPDPEGTNRHKEASANSLGLTLRNLTLFMAALETVGGLPGSCLYIQTPHPDLAKTLPLARFGALLVDFERKSKGIQILHPEIPHPGIRR